MIVPTLRVGMHPVTLCVTIAQGLRHVRRLDAERPGRHSHAERGNDRSGVDGTGNQPLQRLTQSSGFVTNQQVPNTAFQLADPLATQRGQIGF